MPKMKVEFNNCQEIRMGSPFRVCEVVFTGLWRPKVPNDGWQNLQAESPDGRYVALVQWAANANRPGFVIYIFDTVAHNVRRLERVDGCCERIWWNGAHIQWSVF